MKDAEGHPAETEGTLDERKGLLWDEEEDVTTTREDTITQSSRPSRRRCCCASALILLLLSAVVTPSLYYLLRQPRPVADFDSQKLRSNGTHNFKKTALIVSIDGLRYVSCSSC
jgi:hypothetical protein